MCLLTKSLKLPFLRDFFFEPSLFWGISFKLPFFEPFLFLNSLFGWLILFH